MGKRELEWGPFLVRTKNGVAVPEHLMPDLLAFTRLHYSCVRHRGLLPEICNRLQEAESTHEVSTLVRERLGLERFEPAWVDLTFKLTGEPWKDRIIGQAFSCSVAFKSWTTNMVTRAPRELDVIDYTLRIAAGLKAGPLWGDPEEEIVVLLHAYFEHLHSSGTAAVLSEAEPPKDVVGVVPALEIDTAMKRRRLIGKMIGKGATAVFDRERRIEQRAGERAAEAPATKKLDAYARLREAIRKRPRPP